jgi:hypothetical protein
MGNFYVNLTLKGPTQQEVAAAMAGRSAFVTPASDGCVVVFDEKCDSQDAAAMSDLASQLSDALRCPVLAVLNHDDDILSYELHLNGELVDEYNSCPGYFDPTFGTQPSGGDAEKLCRAFDSRNVERVEEILRTPATFAVEQHTQLVEALGISPFAVGLGYNYVATRELPEGIQEEELLQVTCNEEHEGRVEHDPETDLLDLSKAEEVSFEQLEAITRDLPYFALLGKEGAFFYFGTPSGLYRLPDSVLDFPDHGIWKPGKMALYVTIRDGKLTVPSGPAE